MHYFFQFDFPLCVDYSFSWKNKKRREEFFNQKGKMLG